MNVIKVNQIKAGIKPWLILVKKTVNKLGGSFWFVPSVMISIAMVTAFQAPKLASLYFSTDWITFSLGVNSADTAMQVIQVIASSSITVTSIAFSMTLVALVMASNQFGPRLIRNFMQSKSTQFVLGLFTSTFIFCLITLSQITLDNAAESYPPLSIFVAILLAIINVFVLIFFIHHVATAIRADTVVQQTSSSVMRDMHRLQNAQNDTRTSTFPLVNKDDYTYQLAICTQKSGYIQAIEYANIADVAAEYDGIIVLRSRAGKFVFYNSHVATLYSNRPLPSTVSLDHVILTGTERTPLQDPEFAINQLVEMALRALSPSLNDPFTAISCIDKLACAMATFSDDNLPRTGVIDNNRILRVATNEADFNGLFECAFTQIRQGAKEHLAVTCHLLDSMAELLTASNSALHLTEAITTQVNAMAENMVTNNNLTNSIDEHAFYKRLNHLQNLVNNQNVF